MKLIDLTVKDFIEEVSSIEPSSMISHLKFLFVCFNKLSYT